MGNRNYIPSIVQTNNVFLTHQSYVVTKLSLMLSLSAKILSKLFEEISTLFNSVNLRARIRQFLLYQGEAELGSELFF